MFEFSPISSPVRPPAGKSSHTAAESVAASAARVAPPGDLSPASSETLPGRATRPPHVAAAPVDAMLRTRAAKRNANLAGLHARARTPLGKKRVNRPSSFVETPTQEHATDLHFASPAVPVPAPATPPEVAVETAPTVTPAHPATAPERGVLATPIEEARRAARKDKEAAAALRRKIEQIDELRRARQEAADAEQERLDLADALRAAEKLLAAVARTPGKNPGESPFSTPATAHVSPPVHTPCSVAATGCAQGPCAPATVQPSSPTNQLSMMQPRVTPSLAPVLPRPTGKLETVKWSKGMDMREYVRAFLEECVAKNVTGSFLQKQLEQRLPERARYAVFLDPATGKKFNPDDPELGRKMTDAVAKVHGGSTGDTSSQYLTILQGAKWNRFEERIDEYMGSHRRTYFQYCAARGWTDADEEAYEWCYCTKNMLQSLDPLLLSGFEPAREYTWMEASDILTRRVNALAVRGDPYMRGALVAGPNNANLPSV